MTWVTATASVVFGLLLSTRAVRSRTGPWFLDFHRFLGGISVVFLAAHLATLWADSYVEFGVREIFVPGASPWKPEAIAWGIVAAYLLVAIEVSSLLRSRLSNNVWRLIHFSSFGAMIAGSYHAIQAGSDVDNPITWVIAGIGSLLVMGLVSMRLQRQDPDEPGISRLTDNREILEEMRQRLADLPIPESTPQPQISTTPNASLPRRAPVTGSLPGIESETARTDEPTIGFRSDPFAAVPLRTAEPELGEWAEPSPADPFAAENLDPFRNNAGMSGEPDAEENAGRFRARPFTDRDSWADDGADLFEGLVGDPFEALGVSAEPALAPLPKRPERKPDLFAAAVGGELPADLTGSPFDPVRPPASTIDVPAPPVAVGPPPLPTAVDPVTGEPDEAAYTEWLRDWLDYAERYGDEAPEDPARV